MYETIAEFREAMRELGDNLDLLIGTNVRFYIKANPNDGADGIFMNGIINGGKFLGGEFRNPIIKGGEFKEGIINKK